jgi:hypothetical protein
MSKHYKVLSSSITLPRGVALEGEIVAAEQLGDTLDLHLKRGAIEESEGPQEVNLESMKKDELIAHAEGPGVEVSQSMTKAEIIEAIEGAEAE